MGNFWLGKKLERAGVGVEVVVGGLGGGEKRLGRKGEKGERGRPGEVERGGVR
jgi:hypothetical protein